MAWGGKTDSESFLLPMRLQSMILSRLAILLQAKSSHQQVSGSRIGAALGRTSVAWTWAAWPCPPRRRRLLRLLLRRTRCSPCVHHMCCHCSRREEPVPKKAKASLADKEIPAITPPATAAAEKGNPGEASAGTVAELARPTLSGPGVCGVGPGAHRQHHGLGYTEGP